MEALRINDYVTSKLDDGEVIKRVIAGEKPLFEILLRRYNQTLYRVIRSYLKDQDEIQDAMQNAYMKAFEKLYQFQGNSSFSTWLIRIGINEALLRLRILQREKLKLTASDSEYIINRMPDKQLNAEKAIMQREAKQILECAIDSLPEKYRVVYVLKEIENLSNTELAESLGLTDSNVKVRLHRAKALLKESLYKLSSTRDIFEFGKHNCDAMVERVMSAI